MSAWSLKTGLAGIAIVAVTAAATVYAVAQMGPGQMHGMHGQMQSGEKDQRQGTPSQQGGMHGGMGGMHGSMHGSMPGQMMQGRGGMHGGTGQGMHGGMQGGMHGMMGQRTGMSGQPAMPGHAAFGTIQEVVQMLEADPATDWSKVNIAALREHLIDMNEVTLNAAASVRPLDNGVEITVTGDGRTREAIKRMIPAHVGELAKSGWNAKSEDLPKGVKITVTSTDPKQAAKLKALGFMGIMVQGGHHQPHHLMMAKGELHVH